MRRKAVLLGVVIVAALAAVAACVGSDAPAISGSDDAGGGGADGSASDAGPNDGVDGAATDGGGDGGAGDYCAGQGAPDGSADFFCADFDGANLGDGFTDASVGEGGSLATTTLAAASLPASLLASSAAGADGDENDAFLIWQRAGAKTIRTVTATVAMNPFPAGSGLPPKITGIIQLLTFRYTNGYVTFGYTRDNMKANDLTGYTGYFVRVYHKGLVVNQEDIEVDPLQENIWTEVSFAIDAVAGTVSLSYDGASKLDPTTTLHATPVETLADVELGPSAFDGSILYGMRYDDVRFSTTRDP